MSLTFRASTGQSWKRERALCWIPLGPHNKQKAKEEDVEFGGFYGVDGTRGSCSLARELCGLLGALIASRDLVFSFVFAVTTLSIRFVAVSRLEPAKHQLHSIRVVRASS